jgi:hypothetical protein
MYNYIDNQDGWWCACTSTRGERTARSGNTSPAVVSRINTEHPIPQSWFDEQVRMRADIHHLFPTYDTWNSKLPDPAGCPGRPTQL